MSDVELLITTMRLEAWAQHAAAIDAYENDGSPESDHLRRRAEIRCEALGVEKWSAQLIALKAAPIPLAVAIRDVEETMSRIRLGGPWN